MPKKIAIKKEQSVSNTSQKQWLQIAIVVVASVLIVAVLMGEEPSKIETPATEQDATNEQQTLQVREAIGDPEPLSENLQSPSGQTSQEAAGQLQIPRGADSLQPNAKTLDISL